VPHDKVNSNEFTIFFMMLIIFYVLQSHLETRKMHE